VGTSAGGLRPHHNDQPLVLCRRSICYPLSIRNEDRVILGDCIISGLSLSIDDGKPPVIFSCDGCELIALRAEDRATDARKFGAGYIITIYHVSEG
jgi:hypothetical protein